MVTGIRQGSILSPYLFNVYVDKLNFLLSKAGVGCHIAGKTANKFSYADDLAFVVPTAYARNQLFALCEIFSKVNYIEHSTSK